MITCTATQLTTREKCKRPKPNSSIEYRIFCSKKMNNVPFSSFCLALNSSVRFFIGNVQSRDHMHNHVEMLWQTTYTATWKIKSDRSFDGYHARTIFLVPPSAISIKLTLLIRTFQQYGHFCLALQQFSRFADVIDSGLWIVFNLVKSILNTNFTLSDSQTSCQRNIMIKDKRNLQELRFTRP